MRYSTSRRVSPKLVILMLSLLPLLIIPLIITSCRGDASQDGNARGATTATLGPEEEVRFTNGSTSLAGTLFWPAEKADCPAVVVLAGSDRSERGGLRTAIARHFASHGVAAMVYDSPGTGSSSGNALLQSSVDRVAEALSAVAYLRSLTGIRSTAVGLFGGSEGANIALMACAGDAGVAFVIPVSSSLGVSLLDILRYSAEKKGYQQGLTPDEIAQATTFKEIAFVLLSGVEIVEWPLIESRVRQWDDAPWLALIDLARQRGRALTQAEKEAFLDTFRTIIARFETQRWFAVVDVGNAVQRMLSLDANAFFGLLESGRYSRDWERSLCFGDAEIPCPVLAIWGEEDSFLPPHQSAARLKKYLVDSGHSDYEVIVFPGASHFLTLPGQRANFVPGYLDTVVNWVGKRFGS
ncbi:MAG: alpha/beta hydrolase [Candidatus Krumholzibacteria bacterium]|nr:alpha/beta hydrolase [Candidatus Krumholzibacteria bacterium]MDH4337926.1 alpha/beta hydrolase [Candidatus Krumholzibacteria bacterium]MDH5270328.1 alpha/beta hydrolase [Candidatus Krumholzibacteria bacterium]MDH5626247.1 alpha/beta hydrolase [Nitrospira sp.]